MTKILAVGNSFSEDATAYLHDMADCAGVDTKVVNLYIGSCPLKAHWENAQHDYASYDYQLNGQSSSKKSSIKDALSEDIWDYVIMQQVSFDSGVEETYFPYIQYLSAYIREYAPNATQLLHQTWAYEIDSGHSGFGIYNNDQAAMHAALRSAYQKAADTINTGIIPCGDVIAALRKLKEFDYANGGQSLCRDGFHMHMTYGRYATAATWYETILKMNICANSYLPPCCDNTDQTELIECIKNTVHMICNS